MSLEERYKKALILEEEEKKRRQENLLLLEREPQKIIEDQIKKSKEELFNYTGMHVSLARRLIGGQNKFHDLLLEAIPLIDKWQTIDGHFDMNKIAYGCNKDYPYDHHFCYYKDYFFSKVLFENRIYILYPACYGNTYYQFEYKEYIWKYNGDRFYDDSDIFKLKKAMNKAHILDVWRTYYDNIIKMKCGNSNYVVLPNVFVRKIYDSDADGYYDESGSIILFQDGFYFNGYDDSITDLDGASEDKIISALKFVNKK